MSLLNRVALDYQAENFCSAIFRFALIYVTLHLKYDALISVNTRLKWKYSAQNVALHVTVCLPPRLSEFLPINLIWTDVSSLRVTLVSSSV